MNLPGEGDRSHPGGDWITERPGPRNDREPGPTPHGPCRDGYRAPTVAQLRRSMTIAMP
ncbi:predicted protein [Streptomyces viridosporus ATCC 14672]|uniref:Predicted protein n=1 Tax=Streptomyces viridosporus (strain ATCC 14672 / DSM 40746 / JCM 4963 / KCTC 9882 / NRRL B-12104 / FH 1290) TaxID=566461 RepID=D5ZXV1_STRV1|nr:predicted protein [Streptomyces viridosporus ATCC 14672]